MTTTITTRRLTLASLMLAGAAALAACGGSDDPVPGDGSSDPVAPYIGSWISRCVADSGASAQLRADFNKTGANSFTGDVVAYAYVGNACSGPSVRDKKVLSNLQMTHVGTSTLNGLPTDRFNGSSSQGEGKVLLSLQNGQLRIGDPDSPDDAQGYPTAFLEETLTRLN